MAAYDQDISVAFIDDGVYALKKDQEYIFNYDLIAFHLIHV